MTTELDDVIQISHLIVCNECAEIYTSIHDWLTHKEETKHSKDCHSVAIIGYSVDIVHSFDRL